MSGTVVILVHGFRVDRPLKSIAQMRPHFEALDCIVEGFNYGDLGIFAVRRHNHTLARKLSARVDYWKQKNKRVIVVAHSNGAAINHIACKYYGGEPDVVAAINPALWRRLHPAPGAHLVHVWHNEGDCVTWWARLLSKVVPSKVFKARPWGEMGRIGFVGPDRNVLNLNAGRHFPVQALGHSAVFKKPARDYFLPLIANFAFYEVVDLGDAPETVKEVARSWLPQ